MADSFQLVIDDTSPTISFFPLSDIIGIPDLFSGWNPYYTGSGFASTLGQQGVGDSLHITSLDGAALSIQWFGMCASLSLSRYRDERPRRYWYSTIR